MNNPNLEYEDLLLRLQAEKEQQQVNSSFAPDRILELSREHPIVRSLLEKWRCGDLTWEEALIAMVVYLCATNRSLFDRLTEAVILNPPQHFVGLGNSSEDNEPR